jgi:hypothetical protein
MRWCRSALSFANRRASWQSAQLFSVKSEANAKSAIVERAVLIEWFNALAVLTGRDGVTEQDMNAGLKLARTCHPDAVWLCSLFPDGEEVTEEVTEEEMAEVLLAQGDDVRAQYLACTLSYQANRRSMLRHAAEKGYAPAQVAWMDELEQMGADGGPQRDFWTGP